MAVHTDIQTLYLTVYNRPADWVGLLYWAEQIEASGLDAVNQAFTQAPEFDELYAGQTPQQQVNTLYQHLLGRDAEAQGRNYWAAKLEEDISLAEVARLIADAAEGEDASAFEARIDNAQNQTYGEIIDTLYAGYYGRAADAEGKAFWLDAMKSSNGDLAPLIEAFGNSDEYVAQYGGMETDAQLSALYNKLFSREPDSDGAAYWAEQLDSGALTLSSLAFTLAQAASADDKQALENNIQAVKNLEPEPEYAPDAKGILDDYGDTPATASAIGLGETVEGMIDKVTDKDVFAVDLQAGQGYLFQMTPEDDLDTAYLRLLNSDGDGISGATDASDDEAQFEFIADSTNTYYLEASEQGDDDRGNYVVVVEEVGVTTGDDGLIA